MDLELMVISLAIIFFLGYGGWIYFSCKVASSLYPVQPRSLVKKMELACMILMATSSIGMVGIVFMLVINDLKNR